jgi:hypothetical protein
MPRERTPSTDRPPPPGAPEPAPRASRGWSVIGMALAAVLAIRRRGARRKDVP